MAEIMLQPKRCPVARISGVILLHLLLMAVLLRGMWLSEALRRTDRFSNSDSASDVGARSTIPGQVSMCLRSVFTESYRNSTSPVLEFSLCNHR